MIVYDKKFGFELKLEKLQAEANKINQELTRSRIELSTLSLVGPALSKLIQSGLKEQDIINVASIFETYFIGIDRQSSSSSSLRNQLDKAITSLKNEKQNLEIYNQKTSSDLVYLNHKAFFLQGYIDALRNEIIGLSLTAAVIMHFLKLPMEDFQRLKFYHYCYNNNIHNDFLPLIRAHNGEINIPIEEITAGVIKERHKVRYDDNNDNSKLIEILTNTRDMLIQNNNN